MGIEDIKRWQWIVIGLLAGLGLGYAWTNVDPSGDGRNYSQQEFERDLLRRHPKTGAPLLRRIVLRPVTTDYQGKKIQPVTYQRLQLGAQSGKEYWVSGQFYAPVPYESMMFAASMPAAAPGKLVTISDMLTALSKATGAPISFRYGWENERPVAMAIWTIGAVVIVGGLWPTFLNLLIGAGMGRAHQAKKEEDYFDRFSKSAPEPPKVQAAPAVSQAERDRLDEMNRRLEEQLKFAGVLSDGSDSEDPEGKILAPGVRKLEGGALEMTPAAKKADDDDEIEVKGEFYPVLIHHHKHKEEAGAAEKKSHEPAPAHEPPKPTSP